MNENKAIITCDQKLRRFSIKKSILISVKIESNSKNEYHKRL